MSQAVRDVATSYLTSKGMPPHAAAAIVGNLAVESAGFNADVLSGKRTGDQGRSKYAPQWQGTRLSNYEAFARARGKDPSDLFTQLDFVAAELNPRSPYADPIAARNAGAIFGARTVEEATEAFSRYYERPSVPHMDRRTEAARQAHTGWFSTQTANAPLPYGPDETPRTVAAQQTTVPAPTNLEATYASPLGPQGDRVTSRFGGRASPLGIGSTNHMGTDLTAAGINPATPAEDRLGYPAMSVAPGVVTHAGPRSGFGNMVEIAHDDGRTSRYAHLEDTLSVTVGDRVGRGHPVGTVGNTGNSTGPHLHFELMDEAGRQINPATMIDFASARAVPTPTAAPSMAGRVAGVPASTVQSVSIPGAPSMMPDVSSFGIGMGRAGSVAGLPARSVETTSYREAAPVTARAAQDSSMAMLAAEREARANDRVAQAHSVPSARSAQERSMAALNAQQPSFSPSARAAETTSLAAFAASPRSATEALDALVGAPQAKSFSEVAGTPTSFANFAPDMAVSPRRDDNFAAAGVKGMGNRGGHYVGPLPGAVPTIPSMVAAAPVKQQTLPPVTTRNIPSLTRAPVAPVTAAPVAPSTPSVPTGLQAIEGLFSAQAGSTAKPSWEPGTTFTSLGDGRVSMTNRYGVSRDITSDWGRTPTNKGGSIFSEGVFTGKSNNPSGRGGMRNAVVGGLGGLGGSLIGSAFGPIGGLIGGAIGRNLALSRFGAAQPIPLTALDLAAINAVASGLPFPDAPTGGRSWSGWNDTGPGSRDAAMGISPGATAAIDAGRAGLY